MSYRPSDLPNISRHLSLNHSEPIKQNYEDLVNCSVCFEPFDNVNNQKLPKILPCQHVYCVQCIKNLKNISNDGRKVTCPQCQFQVDNLKDPIELPTSRMVLSLLEKDTFNYNGYASCPGCRQIRNLEVCFECSLPLCTMCIGKHFESWKSQVTQNCFDAESNLENYKSRLDQVGNMITQNFDNVKSVKDEIENAFRLLNERLNQEKEQLLASLNEVKDENAKFVSLRKDLAGLINNLKSFREANDSFEKKLMHSKMRKLQNYLELVPKLESQYSSLVGSNFKVLEKFERKPLPDLGQRLSGNLVLKQYTFDSPQVSASNMRVPRAQPSAPASPNPAIYKKVLPPPPPPPKPDTESMRHVNSSASIDSINSNQSLPTNQDVLSRWILVSHIKPQSEMTVNNQPLIMASYQNLLFCMDQTSYITILEKIYSIELRLRNSLKLNVPNIKCIAVNGEYLAVGYNVVKKDQLKGSLKGMSLSGIIVYTRQQHIICSVHDKSLELPNETFKSIAGLAMNESHLFAIDRELHALFKFNLKSGQLETRCNFQNADLVSISLNNSFLTIANAQNSLLHLVEIDNLNQIKSSSLKEIDQVNGHLSSFTTQENLIFVKNNERQISLLDPNLELMACFNEIQLKVISFCLICHQNSQLLIIGVINEKNQFKLLGYSI